MNKLPTIATGFLLRVAIPALLLPIVFGLSSCGESGVDADTAQYVIGDNRDTTALPDLQKAYIEAGIIGEEGNALVGDFINFRPLAIYKVDTLPDGTVLGLRDLHLEAEFGDPDDPSIRHNFYPLRELQFRIPSIEAAGDIQTAGPTISLLKDPVSQDGAGGLKALFIHNGTSVNLVTNESDSTNRGYAYISGIDPIKRSIGLYVKADLMNPIPRGTPNRIVDRMVVKIVLQLPY